MVEKDEENKRSHNGFSGESHEDKNAPKQGRVKNTGVSEAICLV